MIAPADGAIMWLSADDYDPTTGVWNNRADAFYRLRCAARKLVSTFDVFVFANILTVIAAASILALAGWLIGN